MGYVVVLNRKSPIPLRHIVSISGPYVREEFENWYYTEYHKLDGDDFVFCENSQQMQKCVAEAEKGTL